MLHLASVVLFLELILVQRIYAQSTALLFAPGFDGDNLEGEEIGVGTDGTTFVLSGTIETEGIVAPFTMTLVEAATQVVEIAAVRTGRGQDDIVGIGVDCEIGGNEADCVQVFTLADGGGATTIQGTIPIQPTAVPIVNAKGGSAPSASSPQPTGGDNDGPGDNDGGPGLDDGNSVVSPPGFSTNPASGASPTAKSNSPTVPPGLAPKSAGFRDYSLTLGVTVFIPVLVFLVSLYTVHL